MQNEFESPSGNPTMERLEAQIQWYSRKSQHSQKWYKRLKIMAIIAAAAIQFLPPYQSRPASLEVLEH